MTSKNTFNHSAIAELSHMATLRNHLMTISQNQNSSSRSEANELRALILKMDKEIIRRALVNDVEKKVVVKAAVAKKATKKKAAKKSTAKAAVKRSDA